MVDFKQLVKLIIPKKNGLENLTKLNSYSKINLHQDSLNKYYVQKKQANRMSKILTLKRFGPKDQKRHIKNYKE